MDLGFDQLDDASELDGFAVTTNAVPAGTVIAVRGELDMATAPALWAAIRPALRAGQELLLDCANLTFVDARGLAVLMRATRQAVASGATFVITNLARQPRHVIDLAGLRDVLPVRWLPRPHVPAAS